MSASSAEHTRNIYIGLSFRYLLATALCAVFGAVYEVFSHGVYSYWMLYAFGFPLMGGAFPALIMAQQRGKLLSGASIQLWHFGISAFAVGSLFSGALEIYGTSSRLTIVYWMTGGICLLLSLLTALFIPASTDEKAVARQ